MFIKRPDCINVKKRIINSWLGMQNDTSEGICFYNFYNNRLIPQISSDLA